MDYLPDRYSKQPANKEIAQNSNEREDTYSQEFSRKAIDYEYALTLLLSALNHLSCDMALRLDIDPDYLFNKSLIASSIGISTRGIKKSRNDLYREYCWLIDLLKNTNTK